MASLSALPPSPFLSSAALTVEALPAVAPGKDHYPAGSSIDYEAMFDAMYDEILPPEPPPVFLRKPSQAFMRALFELSR
jgi:hypothetical protein